MTCPNLGLRLDKMGPIPWGEAVQRFLVEICLEIIVKVLGDGVITCFTHVLLSLMASNSNVMQEFSVSVALVPIIWVTGLI